MSYDAFSSISALSETCYCTVFFTIGSHTIQYTKAYCVDERSRGSLGLCSRLNSLKHIPESTHTNQYRYQKVAEGFVSCICKYILALPACDVLVGL